MGIRRIVPDSSIDIVTSWAGT